MNFANEILDAIEVMVKKAVEDKTTKIYNGVCQSVSSDGTCELSINGKINAVKYYGGTPKNGVVYRVFIPSGNMSSAFIIVPGEAEGSSSEITSYSQLSDLPKINSVTLSGNKTSADLGLYGTNNEPNYPVTSVNNKSGAVTLTASDVNALPDNTTIPTKTSELNNDSGFITSSALTNYATKSEIPTKTSQLTNNSGYITSSDIPVKSVNGKTGEISLTAADVSALPDTTVIPTVNNGTLTIQKNGEDVATFGANNSANVTANITVPTSKSDIGLSNVDNVKQYSADNPPPYPVTSVNGMTGDVVIDTGGGGSGGGVSITVSETEPESPSKGDWWYKIV